MTSTQPVALLASRSVGGIEFVRSVLPEAALSALALLTWLGSVPFVVGLLAVVYWFGARHRGAFGLGVTLGAFSLTVVLKELFALPRPPAAGQLIGATGYGFPSGHAIASTVVYGYLAYSLDWGSRRQRYAVAAVVVAVVTLSRVAVGVHYVADVVAGFGIAVAYLVALTRVENPEWAFGVGVLISLAAVVATGAGGDSLLLLGGTAAGAAIWPRLSLPASWGREGIIPAIGGGGAIGALVFVGYEWNLLAPVEFAVGAVAVAALLALPVLIDRVQAR